MKCFRLDAFHLLIVSEFRFIWNSGDAISLQMIALLLLAWCALAQVLPNRSSFTNQGFLAPEQSFQFNITCGPLNSTQCAELNQTMHQVGTAIGNDLLFVVPVKVQIGIANGPSSRFTNSATSTNFVPNVVTQVTYNGNELNVSIPRVLVKQTQASKAKKILNNHPLIQDFSQLLDAQSWEMTPDITIKLYTDELRAFKSIVAREITKALGFRSSLQFYTASRGLKYTKIATPSALGEKSGLAFLEPMGVLDMLLYAKVPFRKQSFMGFMSGKPSVQAFRNVSIGQIGAKMAQFTSIKSVSTNSAYSLMVILEKEK